MEAVVHVRFSLLKTTVHAFNTDESMYWTGAHRSIEMVHLYIFTHQKDRSL